MRILVAPDKFKGSLAAAEVAEQIAAGLRDVLPSADITTAPVADGGEGTADVICRARGGEWITCQAHDALGRAIDARYVWLPAAAAAVIDMSEAAGLWRIAPEQRDPVRANTFGVGEMLRHAVGRGAKEITIGLGGSASNDGGYGLARALGFRFFDNDDRELTPSVADLVKLSRIEGPAGLTLPSITAAADVRSPLLGAQGATPVFGSQKGATNQQLELLERALTQLANIAARDLGCDHRAAAGAGAAGGLGFGLMTFCEAKARSGFAVVAEAIHLEEKIVRADTVITGEGQLDGQTSEGKAPIGVAKLARSHGKRVYAIVGSMAAELRDAFEDIVTLQSETVGRPEAMRRASELLRERSRALARRGFRAT